MSAQLRLARAISALALELPEAVHRDFATTAMECVRLLQSEAWHRGYDASTEDGDHHVSEGEEARNPYWREGDGQTPTAKGEP